MSSEFILACVIFLFALTFIVLLWVTTEANIRESETLSSMDESATNAAEKLMRTGGYPANWSALPNSDFERIVAVGLANESRILDSGKLARFLTLMNTTRYDNLCDDLAVNNYNCSRHLLGLGKQQFYANFSYFNGTHIGDTGVRPKDFEYLVSKRRGGLLNESVVLVDMMVWS